MEATLHKEALTETYYDMEKTLQSMIWQFHGKYGGDMEEWRAEANLLFIKAYYTHDENKAAFSSWVRYKVWKGLLDYSRNIFKYCHDIPNIDILKFIKNKGGNPFLPIELLDGATDDAKTLMHLIWNPPAEITNAKIKNGSHPCHMKVVLRRYLSNIGWTGRRIKESFEEIERIIND